MTITRESLEDKTVAELRRVCVDDLGIVGMTKKRKDVIIDAILAKNGGDGKKKKEEEPKSVAPATGNGFHDAMIQKDTGSSPKEEKVTKAEFFIQSTLTKPGAKFGDKTTTTIKVSAGANSGKFPVIGKSAGAVSEFLREVLNVGRLATPVVNGKEVSESYILSEKDTLEFLKPAGRKGR